MLSFAPWQVGLFAVYAIAITTIACYLLIAGDPARQPKAPPTGQAPEFDHDGDIIAVAEQGLAERPELVDDTEAVARTILALEDVARLRALAARDARQVAKHDVLLVEIYKAQAYSRFGDDITKDAPKERP